MKALADRLAAIDIASPRSTGGLLRTFPNYAALASPAPVRRPRCRPSLSRRSAGAVPRHPESEADASERPSSGSSPRPRCAGCAPTSAAQALKREVAALRCGLDAALWDDETEGKRCRDLLKTGPQRDTSDSIRADTLPFDAARAHALYKALFAEVEDLIAGKHLLIVPSGPLTQLPFQVLVTATLSGTDHRATQWLTRKHAISVLPGRVLAEGPAPSGQGQHCHPADARHRQPAARRRSQQSWEVAWAKKAREKQACPQTPGSALPASRKSAAA